MKNSTITKTLIDLGLTENESRVYLAALSLGVSSILRISRVAEVKRTTIYSVIESLKQKGLMSIEVKGFKKYFVAENPQKLEVLLEEKRTRFEDSFPQLQAMYNLRGTENSLKYYEGLESVKNVYSQWLKDIKPHDDYLVISDVSMWHNLDAQFIDSYIQKRARKGIQPRILTIDNADGRKLKKDQKNYGLSVKLLPPNTSISTSLAITSNKIFTHSLKPLS